MESVELLRILDEFKELKQSLLNRVEVPKINNHRSCEINELFTALAKAQSEMHTAGKTSTNPYFKSKYADLAEIVEASRPSLTKNGLCVTQQILTNDDGSSVLHSILGHSSGQWIETLMRILPAKNDVQTLGSYITYLRRYSYAALIGVCVSNEDDDGEQAVATNRDLFAKGASLSQTYKPKQESFEVVNKQQLEELELELTDWPDLAEEILDKMQIQSIADLPQTKYRPAIERIREIKLRRNSAK